MFEKEREYMKGFTDSFTGKLLIGISAGTIIYASMILGADFFMNNFTGQTIHTQERLEQVINTEAKKLGLSSPEIAGVLLSSGSEASYSMYSDGDIGIILAGRKANVPNLRKILYEIKAGIGIRENIQYSDLLLIPNAIFYGITGKLLRKEDF